MKCHCGKRAFFNVRNEKKGLFCAEHKLSDMVNITKPVCEADGCKKIPAYNTTGEKDGRFCAEHREPHMINVGAKWCEADGCETIPAFNIKGAATGRFCSVHKEKDMVNVVSRKCEADGCMTIPNYNVKGSKKSRFCFVHKQPDMIDVKNKKCEFDGCDTMPVFNISGSTTRRFCSKHKEPGMVDIKTKKCEIAGCENKALYNIIGVNKRRFCVEHKEDGMVEKTYNHCEEDGCEITAGFNVIGSKTGRFCAEHKEPNMVNITIVKSCEINGCMKQPHYNIQSTIGARFCFEHKTQDMVNVHRKLCETNGCDTTAGYGCLGKPPCRCAQHREKGMIQSPTRKCEGPCCKELGTHEANGTRYCETHMPLDAENLGMEACSSCGLEDILTNGKCSTCDPQVMQKRRHTKENRVKDLFVAAGLQFVHDKTLEGTACGRERPDFQFDCGTHFVYVEVDEHQHQTYACECEQTRMVNLVHVRGMPVRWIRYNPDVYEPMSGQRKVRAELREKKLLEYTKWAMKHSPSEESVISNVLYLFYDEYDTKSQEWNTLLECAH